MHGQMVKQVAFLPTRHPMTGQMRSEMRVVIDRIVTKEQADKLTRHFKRKPVVNSR